MVGKRPNHDIDTSKFNIIQKGLRGMKERTEHMTAITSGMIYKVSEYQKSSVKKDLENISSTDKKMSDIPQKSKEKPVR